MVHEEISSVHVNLTLPERSLQSAVHQKREELSIEHQNFWYFCMTSTGKSDMDEEKKK